MSDQITMPREEIAEKLEGKAAWILEHRGNARLLRDAALYILELERERDELRRQLANVRDDLDASNQRCVEVIDQRDEAWRERDSYAKSELLTHHLKLDLRSAKFALRLASDENERMLRRIDDLLGANSKLTERARLSDCSGGNGGDIQPPTREVTFWCNVFEDDHGYFIKGGWTSEEVANESKPFGRKGGRAIPVTVKVPVE